MGDLLYFRGPAPRAARNQTAAAPTAPAPKPPEQPDATPMMKELTAKAVSLA